MIKVIGKESISATVLKHSHNSAGVEMVTFEIEYPRFIHSELMTHRMLSKNAASSRAIPVSKMIDQVINNPAMPVFWGKNQAGMQASTELVGHELEAAKLLWVDTGRKAAQQANIMNQIGMHKQLANRAIESHQRMKTVVSGTEWRNFFHLRRHKDAQPEFHELADVMYQALEESKPTILFPGEWHLPYVASKRNDNGVLEYWSDEETLLTVDEAMIISVSCCCQVSYRKQETSLDKAKDIASKLCLPGQPWHFSPFEHQATPIASTDTLKTIGVSHISKDGSLWSGNLKEWIQYRKIIEEIGHNA